jgi:hypothetical protein
MIEMEIQATAGLESRSQTETHIICLLWSGSEFSEWI